MVGAATLIAAPTTLSAAKSADKCNVLLVLVDDMGFADLGCYGSPIIETPTLDNLAANGIRISQFYSAARSSPSRATLMTGLYCHQTGVGYLESMHRDEKHPAYRGMLNDNCVTIAEVVREKGYYTGVAGKWHIGGAYGVTAHKRGFDNALVAEKAALYYSYDPAVEKMTYNDQPLPEGMLPDEWYSSHLYADQTIKYIDEAKSQEKPFFIYLAFNAPHFPIQAPAETIAKYKGKFDKGWDKLRVETYENQVKMGLIDPSYPLSPKNPDIPDWDSLSESNKSRMAEIQEVYAAAVDEMDKSLGRVIEKLRESGELDNTMIVFLSDNGANAESGPYGVNNKDKQKRPRMFQGQSWASYSNTPFRRYKHFTLEGGISSPCIIHYPNAIPKKITGDYITHSYGCFMDIMPTVIDITGAEYPTKYNGNKILPCEGESIMPIIKGGELKRENITFWEHESNKAAREGDWKAVTIGNGEWQLFNIAKDRTEQNNLAAKHPDIVKKLSKLWDEWSVKCNVEKWPGGRNSAGQSDKMVYKVPGEK